jgi:hypothetical protein
VHSALERGGRCVLLRKESHQLSAISRQEIPLASIAEAGSLDFPERLTAKG